jgi:hypothetical protein
MSGRRVDEIPDNDPVSRLWADRTVLVASVVTEIAGAASSPIDHPLFEMGAAVIGMLAKPAHHRPNQ